MTCLDYGFKMCVNHDLHGRVIPCYEGSTCEPYQNSNMKQITETRKSFRRINKTTKACPTCNVRIEKTTACDHFTCVLPGMPFFSHNRGNKLMDRSWLWCAVLLGMFSTVERGAKSGLESSCLSLQIP
jgi:hypothetical protein